MNDLLLSRSQLAFDNCQKHLEESNAWGTEIESYLIQHVLVILCADIQQALYQVLENRAKQAADIGLEQYAIASCKRILRSIKKKEISGFVGYFGSEAKDFFNQHLDDAKVTYYDNAISNRHEVAHASGSNITFRELDKAMQAAHHLIQVVEQAIAIYPLAN